jgi:hypothetical protein
MRHESNGEEVWRLEERRNGQRFTLILRVGVLEQSAKSSLCLVKNISSTGAQIKFYTRPIIGQPASIRVADEPSVEGHVVWVKGETAGLSFDAEMDSARLLRVREKLGPNRRRRVPRVSVNSPATLRTGGQIRRATIYDISSQGARVRTSTTLLTGDRAVVAFFGLPEISAFVRWSNGGEAGLAFEHSIPMQMIADWIEGQLRLSA